MDARYFLLAIAVVMAAAIAPPLSAQSPQPATKKGCQHAADCRADPNALLFAIVDKHVRRVAGAIRVLTRQLSHRELQHHTTAPELPPPDAPNKYSNPRAAFDVEEPMAGRPPTGDVEQCIES